ncbi:MAG: hypothetical protein AAF639_22800 [Chloroflexota bacterium]
MAEDAPELTQLRDAYLAAWRSYRSDADLLDAFELAYKIGAVCRALTWYAMVSTLPVGSTEWHEYADSVPGWLLDFFWTWHSRQLAYWACTLLRTKPRASSDRGRQASSFT